MKIQRGLAGLAVVFACAPAAKAQLTIYMSDGFGNVLTVTDGGVGDINSAAGSIVIDPTLLTLKFPELGLTSLVSGTDDLLSSDSYRYVSENVLLEDVNPNFSPANILIEVGDTGFGIPSIDPKVLSAAFSGTFTNAPTTTGVGFLGEADPANTLFGSTVRTGIGGPNSTGAFLNSFSGVLGYPTFSGTPYSLSDYSIFQLDNGAVVQFTGIATVTPAPEPASLALLVGGVFTLVRRRRC